MDFYKEVDAKSPLSQGDLLYPIPFTGFLLSSVHIRDGNTTKLVDLTAGEPKTGEMLASFETSCGLLLNQSCDLEDHSDAPLVVAQIVTGKAIYGGKLKADKPAEMDEFIRNRFSNAGQSPNRFYLPAFEGPDFHLPISIALLYRIQNISSQERQTVIALRKLSFGPEALDALQEKLAYTFGRFAAPSHLYYSQEEWNHKQQKEINSKKAQAKPITEHQKSMDLIVKEPGFMERITRIFKPRLYPND